MFRLPTKAWKVCVGGSAGTCGGPVHAAALSSLPDLSAVAAQLSGGSTPPPELDGPFDLAVVGGGSGGLAAARRAAKLGARVVLFDYVSPSPHGSAWKGLGGTCNNVGCVPKYLFHQAAMMGSTMRDARAAFGWQLGGGDGGGAARAVPFPHSWPALTSTVNDYVRSSNFSYRAALRQEGVVYHNAKAALEDANTVVAGDGTRVSATHVLVAVGGRPAYPDSIVGAKDVAVSSDDVFTLREAPGKTLVVGGGYVALETAGFLTAFGYDTTVAVRSVPLRGFDRECAQLVVSHMEQEGTTFWHGAEPTAMHRTRSGAVEVTMSHPQAGTVVSEFDTVVLAVGRTPATAGLRLEEAGVRLAPDGKVLGCQPHGPQAEQSSVPSVWAVGDCLHGAPELAPVAIQAGTFLADRLFAGADTTMPAPDTVPTAVFTPTEYACVGLSEEAALEQLGDDNVEVFHSRYDVLHHAAAHRTPAAGSFTKIVSRRADGRVLGLHIVGPNAGEVLQGFSIAFHMGLSMADLARSTALHPTHAEEVLMTKVTKRSGEDPVKTSC